MCNEHHAQRDAQKGRSIVCGATIDHGGGSGPVSMAGFSRFLCCKKISFGASLILRTCKDKHVPIVLE
jgi:hypothetical protein